MPNLRFKTKANVEHPSMNDHNVISIDLAKNVFQVCHLNQHNKVTMNRKVTRPKLLQTVLKLDAKIIVMEACYSSNHWGRVLQDNGYTVKLIPPHQVKPFVIGNKNDHNDAIAIAEASQRPKATFVPVKSYEQQDIQSLGRIRDRLVKTRTSVANQMRGLLAEYGIVFEKTISTLRKNVPSILEDAENTLTHTARNFVFELYDELVELDGRIKKNEATTLGLLENNDDYKRLLTIPGFGPIVSQTTISSINNAEQFQNGRQFSAWVGLTPKQHASGDISRMLGMSKRGNQTLRKQLIHGARAVIRWVEGKTDPLSLWVINLLNAKPTCKVVVALANKLARIAWAVLFKGETYNVNKLAA